MLRSVYPTLIKDYDLRVRSYLEVLAERGLPFESPLTGKVVVHDPCVYARYENMIEPPRKLLAEAGLEVAEPQNSGLLTWCCGGPVEALYPAKAAALAAVRVAQLREVAPDCLTMCPICLVNLRKSADGMRFRDISEYLIEASAPPPETCPTGQPDPAPGLSGR
jgi:Fe-S oxidoreductase